MRLSERFLVVALMTSLSSISVFGPASSVAHAADTNGPNQTKVDFQDFSGLRTEVLSMIGAATKRVWIASDFLTDADIVSSLYIAQYRKVQIQVLLGKDRATNVMSRLGYLKQVNIPVSIRPKGLYSKFPTVILIDDRLVYLNANLDYLARNQKISLTSAPQSDIAAFESAFTTASNKNNAPDTQPLPEVGRPGKFTAKSAVKPAVVKSSKNKPSSSTSYGAPIQTSTTLTDKIENPTTPEPQRQPANGTMAADGSYRYRAVKDRPTNGIPTKLPKTTISQERERDRERDKEKARAGANDASAGTESP